MVLESPRVKVVIISIIIGIMDIETVMDGAGVMEAIMNGSADAQIRKKVTMMIMMVGSMGTMIEVITGAADGMGPVTKVTNIAIG
jgi:hypothetical protein